MKKKNTPYHKGKRWGFAVGRASIQLGKSGVEKADRAMQTCANNARTGVGRRRLTKDERSAYRGMADGIYEAMKKAERK